MSAPTESSGLPVRRFDTLPSIAFAIGAVAIATLVLDAVVLPVLLRESATDWLAYDGAARALQQHISPYAWATTPDVRGAGQFPYLYPPPLALIWSIGFAPASWAVVKVVAVAAAVALSVARGLPEPRTSAGRAASIVVPLAVVVLALSQPPVIHDLLLGNVMLLYAAAIVLLVAGPPGRWSAAPLGFVVAIAFKPAIAPILLWMLLRRPGQLVGFAAAAGVTTAVAAALVGPGVYVDYLAALPRLGTLAQPFPGNVGLSSMSTWLALAAIPVALVWAAAAARRLEPDAGLGVAIALSLLCQPVLGLNYGVVLIPVVLLLWRIDPRAGLIAGILVPPLTLVSPVLAGILTAAGTTLLGMRRLDLRRHEAATPAVPLAAAPR
ncbi:MAG TPA: glycosyltransferase 87 family protein [Candidatus Limnocylindrales bacterium]|nr:glycosyltransferase 87 family protein [Candidatus Limnocylindrales bacterium]